jgi:hypothetical protein
MMGRKKLSGYFRIIEVGSTPKEKRLRTTVAVQGDGRA